jgi:stress response protein SCP2
MSSEQTTMVSRDQILIGKKRFTLRTSVTSDRNVDVLVLGLDAHNTPVDKRYILFRQHGETPCKGIAMAEQKDGDIEILCHAGRMARQVERIAICVAMTGGGALGHVAGELSVSSGVDPVPAPWKFGGKGLGTARSAIVGELVRTRDGWMMQGRKQGFRGGVKALLDHFGYVVPTAAMPTMTDVALPTAQELDTGIAPEPASISAPAPIPAPAPVLPMKVADVSFDVHMEQEAQVWDYDRNARPLSINWGRALNFCWRAPS